MNWSRPRRRTAIEVVAGVAAFVAKSSSTSANHSSHPNGLGLPMVSSDGRQATGSFVPAWIAPALLACAVVLVPWAAILFLTLPRQYGASHWQLAWGGFDVALGIALATTALGALQRSPRGDIAAAVTGTLLICDAWFDVLTSHGSADVAQAVAEAALIELPLAALCFWIANSARQSRERRHSNARRLVAVDRPARFRIEIAQAFGVDDQPQGLAFAGAWSADQGRHDGSGERPLERSRGSARPLEPSVTTREPASPREAELPGAADHQTDSSR
jgi:hypothetical protein